MRRGCTAAHLHLHAPLSANLCVLKPVTALPPGATTVSPDSVDGCKAPRYLLSSQRDNKGA
jgi:hypothetical protein